MISADLMLYVKSADIFWRDNKTQTNNVLTKYPEEIRQKLTYKRWFFGHYLDNRQVNAKNILLYEQLVRVW